MDRIVCTSDDAHRRVVRLVTLAEASVEAMEAAASDGRWAMTVCSRYQLCELLDITPYSPFAGSLSEDPAALLDDAAQAAGQIVVPIDELVWHLALVGALHTAAADIRMVRGPG
jgi:hypothetical protein